MSKAIHMGDLPARTQEFKRRVARSIRMNDIPQAIQERNIKDATKVEIHDIKVQTSPRKIKSISMSKLPDVNTTRKRKELLAPNRRIADVLKDGAWKGQRCFIIAGGASVNDFDLKTLEHEHTIGINLAFRKFNPEIIYSYDARLWGWIETNESGPNDKDLFDKCKAVKVWSNAAEAPLPEDIVIASSIGRPGISRSLQEGLGMGTNSGFGALNLALLLGASEIYLIGFDFYGDRWHPGYPSDGKAEPGYHQVCFEETVNEYKQFPSRIINLNPKSHLKIFEFGEMPTDLKTAPQKVSIRKKAEDEPIFVSYYTPDNGYKAYADDLRASLERWQIDHDIQPIRNRGDWDKNTKAKPEFILKMLDRYPGRDVVWIDADAVVLSLPEILLNMPVGVDFSYGYRKEKDELISSIMFFRNNANSRKLLRKTQEFINTGELHPFGEQIFFEKAMKGDKVGVSSIALPEVYCDILGISTPTEPTVIEMRQASRSLKT